MACHPAALSRAAHGLGTGTPRSPRTSFTRTKSNVSFLQAGRAGPAWQTYNDVEIPNDGTATRFSLTFAWLHYAVVGVAWRTRPR
jgi:hypothetical protein